MFIYNSLVIGPMLPKQTEILEYPYTDITITELSGSCGCFDLADDKERQRVRVKYTGQDIPPHLLEKGGYTSEKFITVKYYIDDPTKIQILKLSFKATVVDGKRRS
jgi:hypothetical protein